MQLKKIVGQGQRLGLGLMGRALAWPVQRSALHPLLRKKRAYSLEVANHDRMKLLSTALHQNEFLHGRCWMSLVVVIIFEVFLSIFM